MQKSNYKCNSYQTIPVETAKIAWVVPLGSSSFSSQCLCFHSDFLSNFTLNVWGRVIGK